MYKNCQNTETNSRQLLKRKLHNSTIVLRDEAYDNRFKLASNAFLHQKFFSSMLSIEAIS